MSVCEQQTDSLVVEHRTIPSGSNLAGSRRVSRVRMSGELLRVPRQGQEESRQEVEEAGRTGPSAVG